MGAACDYRVLRDVAIPVRDGVRLAADIYLPEGDGPWPVLLTRTPYGKGDVFQSQFILSMQFADAVSAGFVVVVQDTRGRGNSEGSFVPFETEQEDGYDTIDWIVAQDFSSGRVSMLGTSYVGATQWAAASSRHPALVSIAPILTSPEIRNDWIFPGGAMQLAFQIQWVFEALAPIEAEREDWRGNEEHAVAWAKLQAMREEPDSAFRRLPILSSETAAVAPHLEDWLNRPVEDERWKELEPAHQIPALPIPALHVIGWNDLFAAGGLRAFERSTARGAPAADRQYLIAGPWSHGNMSDWQGDAWYGYHSSGEGAGIKEDQLELALAAVEGRNANLPRVRYFTSGIDQWKTSDEWPLPGTEAEEFALSADGRILNPSNRDDSVPHPGVVSFRSDPHDPVPTTGGPSFLPGLLQGRNSAQKDQHRVETRGDVVVFTSERLTRDLHVAGVPLLELWGRSDRDDADWVVRLCDVDPSDRSLGVTDGIQRARYRTGEDEPIAPGAAERFDIELAPISHVFRAGHRLRIHIAGSNFPRFDRNPHRLAASHLAETGDLVEAVQEVILEADRPTVLRLPVVKPGVQQPSSTERRGLA